MERAGWGRAGWGGAGRVGPGGAGWLGWAGWRAWGGEGTYVPMNVRVINIFSEEDSCVIVAKNLATFGVLKATFEVLYGIK